MNRAYAKYILSLLLFGSNGIVASHIALSSHEIVLLRTLIGSLLLLCIFFLSKQRPLQKAEKRDWLYLALSGASMGTSWMFLYEAYAHIGVSVATLAYYCGPVLVMAVSPLLFREKITAAKLAGLLAALLGMLLVNQAALLEGGISKGLLYGLLSALTYALMVVFNKRAVGITGLKNAAFQLFISFLTVALFTLSKQGVSLSIPVQSLPFILFLGVVNTGIGCYLYFSSIPLLSAQSVAICGYLEPASALLFSAVFLSERLTPLQWAGTLLILGGAALGELYRRKEK